MEWAPESKDKLSLQYLKCCLSAHNRTAQGDEYALHEVCSQFMQISEKVRGVTNDVFERLDAEEANVSLVLVVLVLLFANY